MLFRSPDPANRVDHILELVARSEVDFASMTVNREPYLQRLDGMVFGPDPREGFFTEGNVFQPMPEFSSISGGWTSRSPRMKGLTPLLILLAPVGRLRGPRGGADRQDCKNGENSHVASCTTRRPRRHAHDFPGSRT